MTRMIASRLIQAPLIIALVFIVTFALIWSVPGDPLIGEKGSGEQDLENKLRQYNLHSPWAFLEAYLTGIFIGTEKHSPPHLGFSLTSESLTVNELLADRLPISVSLGLAALALALTIGLVSGVIGAAWPGSPLDWTSLSLALLGVSLPVFVTATALLLACAAILNWVPTADMTWPQGSIVSAQWWSGLGTLLRQMALPALALSLAPAAYIARLTRLGLADVLGSDYIRTARAKGVSKPDVLLKHALKVAFLPVLSFLGPAAAATLTGSFVVEEVFNIGGMGRTFVAAVNNKDLTVLLGVVVVYATMLVVFNLIVDIAYAWVDPRIEVDTQ